MIETKSIAGLAGVGAIVVLGLGVIMGSWYTVSSTERTIVTRNGAFLHVAEPGLHFKVPLIDSVLDIPITVKQFSTPKLNTYTVDNQEVDAVLTVQYRYQPENLRYVFENVGFKIDLIQAMVVDRWKVEAGRVNVTSIANNRGALVERVRKVVREEAQRLYRIEITDVQLSDLEYQKSFRDAQASAAVVKTQIEQAEGLRRKAEIDAETVKIQAAGVADQAIETARGQAESLRLNAIAHAEAIRVKAIADAEATRVIGTAQAEAQQLMGDAINKNPVLVEYKKAEKWSGILPTALYSGTPIPFIDVLKK